MSMIKKYKGVHRIGYEGDKFVVGIIVIKLSSHQERISNGILVRTN